MGSDKSDQDWKAKATAAYWEYLDALERDLPPDAHIVDIEAAMLKHYRAMMNQTFQVLAERAWKVWTIPATGPRVGPSAPAKLEG